MTPRQTYFSGRPDTGGRRGFTLIEMMIVVAIIGMLAAIGLPAIIKAMQKEGMRKALSDVTDVCASARAKAIFSGQNVAVLFNPTEHTYAVDGGGAGQGSMYVAASKLPDGVEFRMLDINQQNFLYTPGRVWFYPNGTSDEMTIVLLQGTSFEKITLEFSTALTRVSDVDQ